MSTRRAGLGFIFVTLFLDILGLGMIVPILPGLVADLSGGSLSGGSAAYGLLIALYALMQFVFSPVLGSLSDRFGRRPVILASLFGSGLDLLLMAVAPTLAWLAVGRLVAGVTGASITAASAYIADVSPPERRAQSFGLIGAAFGLGFIAGPAFGGVLGEIGPRVPFVAAAVVTLLNWLYGFFVLPESLPPELRRPFSWARANPVAAVLRLRAYPVVFGLAATLVLVNLAQRALESTWVLSTTYRFGWSAGQNGLALALVGLSAAFVQAVVVRAVVPRWGERRAIVAGLSVSALAFAGYGLAWAGWVMYAVIVVGALAGVAGPALQGLISRSVPADEQGAVQGALGGLGSLTGVVGPVVATGLFARFTGPTAPAQVPGIGFLLGAVLILAGLVLAVRAFGRAPAASGAPSPRGPAVPASRHG